MQNYRFAPQRDLAASPDCSDSRIGTHFSRRPSRGSILAALALAASFIAGTLTATPASAADEDAASGTRQTPAIEVNGRAFNSFSSYYASDEFRENGRRCGKAPTVIPAARLADPGDCTYNITNPAAEYEPGTTYNIPVVVHIIQNTSGSGAISDAMVNSQIDILNEDFRAITGTPGAPGYDVSIQFALATTDPNGNPTTGITRSTNNTWFNDGGNYWDSLAWDTANYMNVYTNQAGGNLGYVPDLPQGNIAGSNEDRVVVLWSAFGRNSSGGPPYDQGRTLTHEVGHYLGLEHTFNNGCATTSSPGCYSSGDLICDTNGESTETSGCPGNKSSCGSSDPIDNYMDYSDDTCMNKFTQEQTRRMRCSLVNYRPDLADTSNPVCGNDVVEAGEVCDGTDDSACNGLCQNDCTCPAPVCGNNVSESGEECDGTDDSACSGACQNDCTCPVPVCGNNVTESGEECDGTDDSACLVQCENDCTCSAPVCGNDVTESGEECDGTDDSACPGECENSCACANTVPTACPASLSTSGCTIATQAKIDFNDKKPGGEKLKIQFDKVPAMADFALGDPIGPDGNTVLNTYFFCMYDDAGSLVQGYEVAKDSDAFCSGGSRWCWNYSGSIGYKYGDKLLSEDGIKQIQFRAGSKPKVKVQGANNSKKGLNSMPTGVPTALMGESSPTVQMIATGEGITQSECISAQMTTVKKSNAIRFSAQRKP